MKLLSLAVCWKRVLGWLSLGGRCFYFSFFHSKTITRHLIGWPVLRSMFDVLLSRNPLFALQNVQVEVPRHLGSGMKAPMGRQLFQSELAQCVKGQRPRTGNQCSCSSASAALHPAAAPPPCIRAESSPAAFHPHPSSPTAQVQTTKKPASPPSHHLIEISTTES